MISVRKKTGDPGKPSQAWSVLVHEKRGEVPSERHTSDKQYWLSSTLSRRKPRLMGKREPERNRPLRLKKLR